MTARARLALLVTLAVALLAAGATGLSGASYTARTTSQATIGAAADWTPPTATVTSPGGSVAGSTTVSAGATDGETGIASVMIQYAAAGTGQWTEICTDTTAPYSCAWDTTTVADGSYDLRARATDNAGYTAFSEVVTTRVVNNAAVVLTLPGDVLRGTVTLSAAVRNTPVPPTSLRIERRLSDTTGNWTSVCSTTVLSTLSCALNTTSLATDLWDFRAVAIVATSTLTDLRENVLVDNTAPAVTLADPGTPVSGTKTFAATATDDDSGVAEVRMQYAVAGSSTWTTMCTASTDPYSCKFDTKALADGSYDFRATALDVAGNTGSSTSLRRTVNNTVNTVTLDDPGTPLAGTVTLTAEASSTNGVASVRIQRSASGAATWTDVCTDTTAPYSCGWSTTVVADGAYDLRAVLTDGKANQTASAVVASRVVDNSPLRAVDVQALNGGTTAGRLDTGDQLVLTYSERVATGSVLAGWTGSATSVTVRAADGRLAGLTGSQDVLTVETGTGGTVHLGSVNLRASYVKKNKAVLFAGSTLVVDAVTVNGVPRTVVTLILGTPSPSGSLVTTTSAVSMTWTPSAQAKDLNGTPCSVAAVSETGTTDRDF